jgi:hypothetical protein
MYSRGAKMFLRTISSGLVGALTLTAINETARQFIPTAPRLDVLGMRALSRSLRGIDVQPPRGEALRYTALAGDILSNTLYYSLAGLGGKERAPIVGGILGFAAGIGSVLLPEPLKLGGDATNRTPATQVMSIAWYTLGGLVAGASLQRGNTD